MNTKWLMPGLIILGTFLVVISIWGPQGSFTSTRKELPLALVAEKSGSATIANNQMPAPVALKSNQALFTRDIVRTDQSSDLLVRWEDEGEFRINEKSEVLIDVLENGQPFAEV